MLTQTLRELETSGLAHRHGRETVPSEVDYSLTTLVRRIAEPIELVYDWARINAVALDGLSSRARPRGGAELAG